MKRWLKRFNNPEESTSLHLNTLLLLDDWPVEWKVDAESSDATLEVFEQDLSKSTVKKSAFWIFVCTAREVEELSSKCISNAEKLVFQNVVGSFWSLILLWFSSTFWQWNCEKAEKVLRFFKFFISLQNAIAEVEVSKAITLGIDQCVYILKLKVHWKNNDAAVLFVFLCTWQYSNTQAQKINKRKC